MTNHDDTDMPRPSHTIPPREHLLAVASKLTLGERNKAYGEPHANHTQIARLWNAYLRARAEHEGVDCATIDAEDVAICMVLLKVARAAQRQMQPDPVNFDTFVDMVAYAAIAGECRDVQVIRSITDQHTSEG